jgi:predicted HD phosphohydrolase
MEASRTVVMTPSRPRRVGGRVTGRRGQDVVRLSHFPDSFAALTRLHLKAQRWATVRTVPPWWGDCDAPGS